jgi:hypothetical protein
MLRCTFIFQVSFEPSLRDVTNLIAHTLRDIVDCILPIPRLVEKFNITSNNMQAFWVDVEQDDECKHLQELITQGKANCIIINLEVQHC